MFYNKIPRISLLLFQPEIQQLMQAFAVLVQDLPRAVEFPGFAESCGPDVAAALLDQVSEYLKEASREWLTSPSDDNVDGELLRAFGLRIPLHLPLPKSTPPTHNQSTLGALLARSLTVPALLCPSTPTVQYSVQQYLTLVDMHRHSPAVQHIMQKHRQNEMDMIGLAGRHPLNAYFKQLLEFIEKADIPSEAGPTLTYTLP